MKRFLLILGCLFFSQSSIAQQATAGASSENNIGVGVSAGSNAGVSQSIVFPQGGGHQGPFPGIPGFATHQAPGLYQFFDSNYGVSVELPGMALDLLYNRMCKPREGMDGESKIVEGQGPSRYTHQTFTTHPQLQGLLRGSKFPEVSTEFSPAVGRYKCLGLIQGVATKKALEKGIPIGVSAVASDMRRFVRSNLEGIEGNVYALTAEQFLTGAFSVTSGSSGWSLGLSWVSFLFGGSTGGAAPGIGSGNGSSSPAARVGFTAMVLLGVPEGDPSGVSIDIKDVPKLFQKK